MLSSGKTGKEWCLENGVKYSTFRAWLDKYKRREQESEAVWIEVLKKGGAPALTSSGVEVHIGGYIVRIAPGFDSDVFLNVCRSLSVLC
jgi:hypothetical protein